MTYLNKFFELKKKLKEVALLKRENQQYTKWCEFCYQPDCDCGETITYKDVLEQLNWWLGIAIQEALAEDEALLVEEKLVPKIPCNGKYDPDIKYTTYPKFSDLKGVLVEDELVLGFDEDGVIDEEFENYVESLELSDGIYWGYWFDQFYIIRKFDPQSLQWTKEPPSLPEVEFDLNNMEIEIPKHLGEPEGYWVLPDIQERFNEYAWCV